MDGCGCRPRRWRRPPPWTRPDVSSLDRDRDIVVPRGLLVLPEPVVVNRADSLSDTAAFGWDMDRDGPVEPEEWRQVVSHGRPVGSPMPRGCLAKESTEYRAHISEQYRELQYALNSAAQWRAEPAAEMGEWNGERINDVHERPPKGQPSVATPPTRMYGSSNSPSRSRAPTTSPVNPLARRSVPTTTGGRYACTKSASGIPRARSTG